MSSVFHMALYFHGNPSGEAVLPASDLQICGGLFLFVYTFTAALVYKFFSFRIRKDESLHELP